MQKPRPESSDAHITQFSFWKPEPVPTADKRIAPVELLTLGALKQVLEKLLDVPNMVRLVRPPWEEQAGTALRLVWQVDSGVLLKVRAETGPPRPGEVLTISAVNSTPRRTFYRLYVQIFEQFGATVLDERSHQFLSPREFRQRS